MTPRAILPNLVTSILTLYYSIYKENHAKKRGHIFSDDFGSRSPPSFSKHFMTKTDIPRYRSKRRIPHAIPMYVDYVCHGIGYDVAHSFLSKSRFMGGIVPGINCEEIWKVKADTSVTVSREPKISHLGLWSHDLLYLSRSPTKAGVQYVLHIYLPFVMGRCTKSVSKDRADLTLKLFARWCRVVRLPPAVTWAINIP